jgi:hypothetical protein
MDAGLRADIMVNNEIFGMSFGEGVSEISRNVAAHPAKGWTKRQQQSRGNAIV